MALKNKKTKANNKNITIIGLYRMKYKGKITQGVFKQVNTLIGEAHTSMRDRFLRRIADPLNASIPPDLPGKSCTSAVSKDRTLSNQLSPLLSMPNVFLLSP